MSSNPLNYRVVVGHDSVKVLFDCPQCGGVAAVRDHLTAASSGRSWIDCAGGCLSRYGDVDQEFCRGVRRKHHPDVQAKIDQADAQRNGRYASRNIEEEY